MATPAAILQIAVEANTRSATSSLTKLDRKLTAIDKTSATATTRTSALGKASKATSGHLASAAKYAAGAALAYLSIAQAKAAVTTTQDLAKATLGLQKNLGLSGRAAGEWAAAASSRGVETTKLTMAFKTLATQVEAARGGSATAVTMFKRLGIGMDDLNKGSKDVEGLMLQIADGMDQAGAGTERMTTASKLFGRGFAGIAPLIRDGSAALQENLQQTEKYGAALHGGTLADQEKLRGLLIESKTAWLGLKVTFTQAITPALDIANEQFQKLARIMADDRLTNAEKFKKVGEIIGKWADKALDVFVAILPQIISRAGEAAPKIAGALVQGFMDAPVWGKLFLGGFLLSKLGGLAAAGARMGTVFGTSFAGTAAPLVLAAASPAILAKIGTDELRSHITPVTQAIRDQFGITQKAAEKVVVYMQAHPGLGAPESLALLRRAAKIANQDWSDAWTSIVRDASRGGRMVDENASSAFGAFAIILDKQTSHGLDVMSKNVAKIIGKSAEMKQGVTANVNGMVGAVMKGFGTLASQTNKALKAFGVKPLAFDVGAAVGASFGDRHGNAHQKGGLIVGGTGSGDKVPAMLEPGEVVWNREAVAAMGGAAAADAMNAMIPRFAAGGVVPGDTAGLHPGILGLVNSLASRFGGSVSSGLRAGDTGSLHSTGQAADYVPDNWAGASRAVNAVGSKLLEGIYNPGTFGGSAVSWDTGAHVPSSFWGAEWGNHLDHIHLAIADGVKAAASRMVRQIKRQMLNGPDGPLKAMGQAALDKVRGAANKFISSKAPTGITGDVMASSYKGPLDHVFPQTSTGAPGAQLTSSQMNKVRASAGLPSIFNTIAQRESGWHPGIVSFDGGYGLWQITKGASGMDSVIAGMGGYGQMLNPIKNAQIAGTMYRSRGLSPWAPSGPYQRGGVIPYAGAFHNGGVVGESMARVTKGETIRTQGQEASLMKGLALFAKGGAVVGPGRGGRGHYHTHGFEIDYEPYGHGHYHQDPNNPVGWGVGTTTVHGGDQALIDAMAATAQALADLQASIDAQNALTVAVGSSDGYQALRAIADLLSGELGGRMAAIGHTAGSSLIGSAVRS